MIKSISEKTLLPISLVITLSGGVFWLTNIYSKQEANAQELSSLKNKMDSKQEKIDILLSDILQRVTRIEEAVKRR